MDRDSSKVITVANPSPFSSSSDEGGDTPAGSARRPDVGSSALPAVPTPISPEGTPAGTPSAPPGSIFGGVGTATGLPPQSRAEPTPQSRAEPTPQSGVLPTPISPEGTPAGTPSAPPGLVSGAATSTVSPVAVVLVGRSSSATTGADKPAGSTDHLDDELNEATDKADEPDESDDEETPREFCLALAELALKLALFGAAGYGISYGHDKFYSESRSPAEHYGLVAGMTAAFAVILTCFSYSFKRTACISSDFSGKNVVEFLLRMLPSAAIGGGAAYGLDYLCSLNPDQTAKGFLTAAWILFTAVALTYPVSGSCYSYATREHPRRLAEIREESAAGAGKDSSTTPLLEGHYKGSKAEGRGQPNIKDGHGLG